ncbi:helix-turn-helix domain-containing protein [Paenibacillus xylanilyticus]|nr:helix-turn-helix domain-containing protein [Paenibacillus xylanilyticus]
MNSTALLPNSLTANDIHAFTNIKLRTVYDLMNTNPENGGIPVFRIGRSLYSDKEEFITWWALAKERGRKNYSA